MIAWSDPNTSTPEELVDQFPADHLFPEQHLKDLVAEEVFQFLYVYFRKDVKPPVRHEAAVGDEAMARTARMHCHPYFRMIEDSKIREVMQIKLYSSLG